MAVIGRGRAVAEVGSVHFYGFAAWVAWLFVHVLWLVGFGNRVVVLFQWASSYLTLNRSARIITGEPDLSLTPVRSRHDKLAPGDPHANPDVNHSLLGEDAAEELAPPPPTKPVEAADATESERRVETREPAAASSHSGDVPS